MDAEGNSLEALQVAMFRALTESSEAYVSCVDRQRRVLFANRSFSWVTGESLGAPLEDLMPEAHRAAAVHATELAFRSGKAQRLEFDLARSDAGRTRLEMRILPFQSDGAELCALLVTSELTDQHQLVKELSRSEDFRKLIVENLPDFVSLLDRQRRFRWVNRLAPGLEMERVIGATIDEFVAPETLPAVKTAIESVFETGQPSEYEVEGYGDGNQKAFYVTRVISVASDGPSENVLLITTNVSDHRRAELALRASEEKFRALAEDSPDFIAIVDRSRHIEYLNRTSAGKRREEFIGKRIDELTSPEQLETAIAVIESVFVTGANGEYETTSLDGASIFRVRVAPLAWTHGRERVLMVTTDITKARADELQRESLLAQLHQAQRRESVGTLAGGIAHDFNNLLQVIQSNLYFARESMETSGLPLEEVDAAMRATDRAAELTTHLLAVGRRQRVDPKRVDLSKLIERSLRMLRRVIPENIDIRYTPSVEPCSVSADAPQLEQVLLNLCLNARDAMPSGGTLQVSVTPAQPDGTLVRLCVADTGTGIEDEHLKRIFEPFFSTKGAGSGLGLAVVSGIVAAHHGTISVESSLGQGSKFIVELPRVTAGGEESVRPPSERPRGNELILVAEDEPLVRSQLVRTLRRAGYNVLQAENGLRAVELFQARQSEIALVLLDVIMPGLDGWQVYLRLEAMRPSVKAVFITGYAAHALPLDFDKLGKRLLSKPYKPQALLDIIREALDGT